MEHKWETVTTAIQGVKLTWTICLGFFRQLAMTSVQKWTDIRLGLLQTNTSTARLTTNTQFVQVNLGDFSYEGSHLAHVHCIAFKLLALSLSLRDRRGGGARCLQSLSTECLIIASAQPITLGHYPFSRLPFIKPHFFIWIVTPSYKVCGLSAGVPVANL